MMMTSSASGPYFFTTAQFIIRFKKALCNEYLLYVWWQQPPSTATTMMTMNKQMWSTEMGDHTVWQLTNITISFTIKQIKNEKVLSQ
jgi:hypothetical protein